jgi:putative transposase
MHKAFVYRLYPNRNQDKALANLLGVARIFYNAALQERRDAWKHGVSLNYYNQANQLKGIRLENEWCTALNCSATQDILRRLDKSFKAFFRRIKHGEKPGYPRFKGRDRFDSITFPTYGDGIRLTDRLYVQNVGRIKVKLHRPIMGQIKTVTVKRECDKWYAVFTSDIGDIPLNTSPLVPVGIDVGLTSFAALSNGELLDNPRNLRIGQAHLRRCQRRLSRRRKGSVNRRKARKLLAKAHARIRHQRADFHHKRSRELADTYNFIAVEDLNIKGMVRNHCLAKSISDAGWSYFLQKLAYKVEETGGRFVKVRPHGTSQACSQCGCLPDVPKTLADRIHTCPACGLTLNRDVNAARNILRLGLSLWDITWENTPCVSQEAVCFS